MHVIARILFFIALTGIISCQRTDRYSSLEEAINESEQWILSNLGFRFYRFVPFEQAFDVLQSGDILLIETPRGNVFKRNIFIIAYGGNIYKIKNINGHFLLIENQSEAESWIQIKDVEYVVLKHIKVRK